MRQHPRPFSVCVFAGACSGSNPSLCLEAGLLGEELAREKFDIIYGGGASGLMGALANGALSQSGNVVGILPQQLADLELAHPKLSETVVVRAMHERKALFHERSNAFVVLPGGVGTFDELFETLAWLKLGIHSKPVILLNSSNYFDPTVVALRAMCREGFVEQSLLDLILIAPDSRAVLQILTQSRLASNRG